MLNITIYTTELRRGIKGVLIWSLCFSLLAIMLIGLYNSIQETLPQLEEILKAYPQDLMAAFGRDTRSLSTIEGYFSGQFLTMLILLNSIYAVIMGANTLGKELSNGSAGFLLTKSVSRLSIFTSKALVIFTNLAIINLIILVVTLAATELLLDVEYSLRFFATAFYGALVFQCMMACFGIAAGVILDETKATFGGIALVFASLIVSGLSMLDGVPEFIRYFAPHYYLNTQHIAAEYTLKLPEFWMLPTIALVLLVAGAVYFRNRDVNI